MTANKQLYFEVLQMLALVGIRNEHLDADSWTFEEARSGSGSRQRVRSRREGLRNFRSGVARVLVLNLLVSYLSSPKFQQPSVARTHPPLQQQPLLAEWSLHGPSARLIPVAVPWVCNQVL